MNTLFLDRTANGLPIPAYAFGASGPRVLVLGGVHGDEREGVELALGLLARWRDSFPFALRLTLVPMLNLDGVLRHQRGNARGVDLNRNLPTKDWSPEIATPRYHPGPTPGSEPENQALIRLVDDWKPAYVFSLHSFRTPMLNVNGECRDVAAAASATCGLAVEETIGYPTPGCLGTFAGLERGIPTITWELLRGMPVEPILRLHVPALEEALKVIETKGSKS